MVVVTVLLFRKEKNYQGLPIIIIEGKAKIANISLYVELKSPTGGRCAREVLRVEMRQDFSMQSK